MGKLPGSFFRDPGRNYNISRKFARRRDVSGSISRKFFSRPRKDLQHFPEVCRKETLSQWLSKLLLFDCRLLCRAWALSILIGFNHFQWFSIDCVLIFHRRSFLGWQFFNFVKKIPEGNSEASRKGKLHFFWHVDRGRFSAFCYCFLYGVAHAVYVPCLSMVREPGRAVNGAVSGAVSWP